MPLIVPLLKPNGKVDLLVAYDEDALKRIRNYDPGEIVWSQFPAEYRNRLPGTISITFCSAEEQREIERLSVSDPDWKEKAFEKLTRGFEYQPDRGDHDMGPIVLGKKVKNPQ